MENDKHYLCQFSTREMLLSFCRTDEKEKEKDLGGREEDRQRKGKWTWMGRNRYN